MSSERWRRVEEVYHAALEHPAGERSAFVSQACRGDADLEREVRSLLDQESVPGFLSGPAIQVAARLVEESASGHWIGRRIGVYSLDALLGKGGMGEVYRARDTRLGRDVAIKVLPKAFTANPERLARFEREARLLAALNHPHIGMIHGVEEAPGTLALVLELVEGDTLADRVRFGPLPVRDALNIARQIADALDAAHDKGIVHRDLKPANVKITPQAVVKVLDFGLAKSGTSAHAADLAHSPTITAGGTEEGVILGTAAYMSPEQARGQTVDKRADVWAFGCVLYELLTGRAAFAEQTSSDTIAAILRRDPDWDALPAGLPPSVTTLLHRCLEKDLHRRKRELGDARAELDDAMTWRAPAQVRHAGVEPRSRSRAILPWSVAIAALVAAAAMATAAFWPRWQNPLDGAEFIQLTSFPGAEENAVISPDGRWVAFLSDQTGPFHLFVTPIGPGGFSDLTPQDTDQRLNRAGSPDIGFSGDGLEIWLGGSPRRTRRLQFLSLTSGGARRPFLGENVSTITWSPDGRRIVYNTNEGGDPFYLADRQGSDSKKIFGSASGWHNHGPIWGPGGDWIYFAHGQPDIQMDVWRIRAQPGSEPEALTQGASVSTIAPLDSSTVLYTGRAADGAGPWLWALDLQTKISHRISSGLEQYTAISASADGRTLAASRSSPRASLWAVPILEREALPSDVQPYGPVGVRAWLPRVRVNALYFLSAFGTGDGLWRFQNGQTTEIWKGAQGALLEPPAISYDGVHAAVILRKDGRRTLTVVDTDGSGSSRPLADTLDVLGLGDWSPDGKWILATGRQKRPDGTSQEGIFKVPVEGSGSPVLLVEGPATDPVWAAGSDTATIHYAGPDIGGVTHLMQFREGGTSIDLTAQMNAVVGSHRFLPDGSGVVFVLGGLRSPEFWLFDLKTKQSRRLTRISGQASLGDIRGFDVSSDGKFIIFDRVSENSDVVLIKR
jgi:Tol biopolymer transport system component